MEKTLLAVELLNSLMLTYILEPSPDLCPQNMWKKRLTFGLLNTTMGIRKTLMHQNCRSTWPCTTCNREKTRIKVCKSVTEIKDLFAVDRWPTSLFTFRLRYDNLTIVAMPLYLGREIKQRYPVSLKLLCIGIARIGILARYACCRP